MIGQSSIEFISLVTLSLIAMSVLVSDIGDRTAAYTDQRQFIQAQKVAEKASYKLEYVNSNRNSTVVLDFPARLRGTYTMKVNSNSTVVQAPTDRFAFRSLYTGKKNFTFTTSQEYRISYNGGVTAN